jgi:hypothetical protein
VQHRHAAFERDMVQRGVVNLDGSVLHGHDYLRKGFK